MSRFQFSHSSSLFALFALMASSWFVSAEPAVFSQGKLTIPEGAAITKKGKAYFTDITLAQNDQGDFIITGANAKPLVSEENVEVLIMESFPLQVSLSISGFLSVPCVELLSPAVSYTDGLFQVVLAESTMGPAETCIAMIEPFEISVPLEVAGLPAGIYGVDVNGLQEEFTFAMDNGLFE
jgi:hypothetical protein